MLPDIKHYPVNWVEGMRISSRDFIAQESAFADSVRDARATHLHAYAYGLLPANHPEVDHYPKLVCDYAKGLLVLKECRAVTPGGQRIEITEANHEQKKYPAQLPSVALLAQESGRFEVYMHVDVSVRVGAGEFAGNNPPRYSNVAPRYQLSLRPADGVHVEQENFLKISEIEVSGGRVAILTNTGDYIPPCTTTNASAALKRLHNNGEEKLKALIGHHSNLVNRMGAETRNDAAKEALQLAEKIVTPLVSSLSYYRYVVPFQAPVCAVVYLRDYVRTVKFQLDRPFRAEIINRYKPALLELADAVEKNEPQHAAVKLSFDCIYRFLEELDHFLAELGRHKYDKQFDLYDHNRAASGPSATEAAQARTVAPPAEPQKPWRIF